MNYKENDYNNTLYKSNQIDNNTSQQKYNLKFEFINKKLIPKNKNTLKNSKNKSSYFTWDDDNNEDFLLSFKKRFDDIFKQIKGHEKIFEDLEKKQKKKKVSNEIIKAAVFLRKLNFQENFPKKRKKQIKIDVEKVIEIQKIFKGHVNRNINFQTDRLRLRQCLIELFCLLIYGNWYKAKIRYNFYLLKYFYNTSKLEVGNELTDRKSTRLNSSHL